MTNSGPTRKDFLKLMAWQAMAAAAPGQTSAPAIPGKRPMILHNEYPEDLESPLDAFDTWLTPIDAFFVRQHIPRPTVDLSTWKLEINGLVEKPVAFSLSELRGMRQYTVPATLECAGNGRAYFHPTVPGLQWKKGGIGNAEWRGVRVADLLQAARPKSGASWLDVDGADQGAGKTPDFIRSITMRKALDPATLIALEMNGQPLPEIHGGPTRLIAPGFDGASWVKWATRMTVGTAPNNGFFMNPAYRIPKYPVPPGTAAKPEDLVIVEAMPVKSFFVSPADGSSHNNGVIELRGIAWSGEQRIARVDVSVDRGITWHAAKLGREDYPSAWRLWRFEWEPLDRGYHQLMCRATDSSGATQPLEAAWNPSGYLWNSLDRIGVTVGG
jgi:sulfite oxidase